MRVNTLLVRVRRTSVAVFAALFVLAGVHSSVALAQPTMPPISDPPTGSVIPGKFVWFELVTGDPVAARRFYGAVFGWTHQRVSGAAEDYSIIRNEGRGVGGIFRPALASGKSVGARWLAYASSAALEQTVKDMTSAGATVLVRPTKVAGRGVHALVADPQGAIVGLMRSESGDPPDDPVAAGDFFWVDLYVRDPAAAARFYEKLYYDVFVEDVTGDDRIVLSSKGIARAGIMRLGPNDGDPVWLPYVQVDDVPATLARVRAGGGKVLRAPDPAILDGQLAVFADPQGAVLGILNWPLKSTGEGSRP
jgi:predicted enzyme related to lactoylglutathione lyase